MSQKIGVNRQHALRVIFATIDEINETLPADRQLEKSLETHLFGRQGALESIEFVNFIVLLEERIADEMDRAVTLADEKAISRETSPFSTVERLADYVTELLRDSSYG
ncbi:MAG: hypothetical protein M3410_05830 [Acidobacteriota bacterium]|nr:hypothetical protein [Acidobacteriota bacterium]